MWSKERGLKDGEEQNHQAQREDEAEHTNDEGQNSYGWADRGEYDQQNDGDHDIPKEYKHQSFPNQRKICHVDRPFVFLGRSAGLASDLVKHAGESFGEQRVNIQSYNVDEDGEHKKGYWRENLRGLFQQPEGEPEKDAEDRDD